MNNGTTTITNNKKQGTRDKQTRSPKNIKKKIADAAVENGGRGQLL